MAHSFPFIRGLFARKLTFQNRLVSSFLGARDSMYGTGKTYKYCSKWTTGTSWHTPSIEGAKTNILKKSNNSSGNYDGCVFSAVRYNSTGPQYNSNFYKALELDKEATAANIKSAYYRLSKLYHPDKQLYEDKSVTEKFSEITRAYEILGNAESRTAYDKWLKGGIGSEMYNPNRSYPEPGTTDPGPKSTTFKKYNRRKR